MSTLPSPFTPLRRATPLNLALATAVAIVSGFVLGFASQALGAEEAESDPALQLAAAAARLDEGVHDVAGRMHAAQKAGDQGLAQCISRSLLVLHGAQRAVRNAEDDHALARMRGDAQAADLALDRGLGADLAGRTLLAEARGCAATDAILGRANGVTVLRIEQPGAPEDQGFGAPEASRAPPARR